MYGNNFGLIVIFSAGNSVREVSQITITPSRRSEPTNASSLLAPSFNLNKLVQFQKFKLLVEFEILEDLQNCSYFWF